MEGLCKKTFPKKKSKGAATPSDMCEITLRLSSIINYKISNL